MPKSPPNPCKRNCPLRSEVCHANCKEYAEFYRGRREENDAIRAEKGFYSFRNEARQAVRKAFKNLNR